MAAARTNIALWHNQHIIRDPLPGILRKPPSYNVPMLHRQRKPCGKSGGWPLSGTYILHSVEHPRLYGVVQVRV